MGNAVYESNDRFQFSHILTLSSTASTTLLTGASYSGKSPIFDDLFTFVLQENTTNTTDRLEIKDSSESNIFGAMPLDARDGGNFVNAPNEMGSQQSGFGGTAGENVVIQKDGTGTAVVYIRGSGRVIKITS